MMSTKRAQSKAKPTEQKQRNITGPRRTEQERHGKETKHRKHRTIPQKTGTAQSIIIRNRKHKKHRAAAQRRKKIAYNLSFTHATLTQERNL